MSSFQCELCNYNIIDTDQGYVSACPHYPLEDKRHVLSYIKVSIAELDQKLSLISGIGLPSDISSLVSILRGQLRTMSKDL